MQPQSIQLAMPHDTAERKKRAAILMAQVDQLARMPTKSGSELPLRGARLLTDNGPIWRRTTFPPPERLLRQGVIPIPKPDGSNESSVDQTPSLADILRRGCSMEAEQLGRLAAQAGNERLPDGSSPREGDMPQLALAHPSLSSSARASGASHLASPGSSCCPTEEFASLLASPSSSPMPHPQKSPAKLSDMVLSGGAPNSELTTSATPASASLPGSSAASVPFKRWEPTLSQITSRAQLPLRRKRERSADGVIHDMPVGDAADGNSEVLAHAAAQRDLLEANEAARSLLSLSPSLSGLSMSRAVSLLDTPDLRGLDKEGVPDLLPGGIQGHPTALPSPLSLAASASTGWRAPLSTSTTFWGASSRLGD